MTRVHDPYAVKAAAAPDDREAKSVQFDRLVRVDLSDLANCTTDPTQYAIERILPRGHVTLLGGHGGSGKSMLALTLASHVASGRAWSGLTPDPGRAVFISLEDPGDLARYRLRRICDEYCLQHAEVAEFLAILDGSGVESALAVEIADAGVRRLIFTSTTEEIEVVAEGCRLLVIDNASDAFAANENDRHLVRSFIRRLAQIARRHDCAILLLAHIDKAAARYGSAGNSYSGSTAWHNSVRSRLALIEDEASLLLVQEKCNLGKPIEPISLDWSTRGVLVPVETTGSVAVERDAQDDADLLAAMQAAIADGATLHTARKGPYSIRGVLDSYTHLSDTLRRDKRRFWSSLDRLVRSQRIGKETYQDRHRHDRERFIVRAPHPHTPCVGTHAGDVRPAPLLRSQLERDRHAVATRCPRCDGAGCQWCCKEQPDGEFP